MPFSGIQGIGENFNGIQGINSNNKQLQLRFLEMNPHVRIRPVTAGTVRSVSMKFYDQFRNIKFYVTSSILLT